MNIAVIGVGILPVNGAHGIPAFQAALEKLSETHFVTLYSFIPVLRPHPKIRVRCVPSKRWPQRLQYLYIALLFVVDHLVRRYSVIHAQSPFPAGVSARALSKWLKVPWLLSFHAGEAAHMPEVPYGDLLNPFLKKVNALVTKGAPVVMAMSNHQANMIRANLAFTGNIVVLPRGTEVPPLLEKTSPPSWTFLHVSYNQPVKGADLLLHTFRYIVDRLDCKLVVVGGNYGADFKSLVRRLDLDGKVILLGSLPHPEVLQLMTQCDALIHTSFCEGLPMVALEAMAHGLLVCGTAVGIMADLSPSYCITDSERNAEKLGAKIITVCSDNDMFQAMRRRAWHWVKEHDLQWYINELAKCYETARSAR